MRLSRLDQEDRCLLLPTARSGRKDSDRLREATKFKLTDREVFRRVEELLIELSKKIKVDNAGFFLSVPQDVLIASANGLNSNLQLHEFDELLLFSGQPVKNKEFYYQPVESNNQVIGYISVKISEDQRNDLIQGIIDNYASLILHEYELAQKKSKLETFSEKLIKKKEELEKAQEYNKNLISITSHDLSSPLNAVSGYLDLMNEWFDENDNPDQIQSYHKRICSGIQDVMDMLRQLNDISRIERGVISFNMVQVNFVWVVQEVFDLIESKAIAKRIQFELQAPEYPIYVKADTVKLKRVIHNLIANAIKYTPVEGKITVKLSDDGELAFLKVQDNGIGIPESHYSKIFAPFVKLDPSKEDANSSSGLGLYIASYFTDLMNGEISLESQVGKGSTFTVSLPLVQVSIFENRQTG
jgi:signal transduction histidine kinase